MLKKIFRNQKGIGLLELMLSLAIIAILLITATRYYKITRTSQQVNTAADIVIAVYTAGSAWLQSQNDFSGEMLSKFVANGSLPTDFSKPNINPWGGQVTSRGGSTPTTLAVTLTNIPRNACEDLQARITAKFPVAVVYQIGCPGQNDPTTFNVIFDMGK